MRGSWLGGIIGLVGLAGSAACGADVSEALPGSATAGGGSSSKETCTPGSVEPCYTGPDGTLGVGICTGGFKTCNPEGTGYGHCIGQVTPQAEACGNLTDDDCNGQTNEQGPGCVCLPGSTADCAGTYSGPPGTEGVGACHGQRRTCNAEGTAYSECSGDVLPQVETCNTAAESPADEDCDGQTNEGVCKFVAVAGGYEHSLLLRSDGTVWASGTNQFYDLGNGTTVDSLIPVQVSKLDRITAISAGSDFSLALRSDGSVWVWGSLGPYLFPIPEAVPSLSSMTAISAGWLNAFAIRSDGTVWAWGASYGGDGTDAEQGSPVQVLSLPSAAAVAGCESHSLAVDSTGGVWAWGQSTWGQVGLETYLQTVPIPVAGVDQVTAVAGGLAYSLGLRSDGTVWAWGTPIWGTLGNGPSDGLPHPTPTAVMNLTSVTAIAAGRTHALALRSDGTLWTWGEHQNIPAIVPTLSDVVAIAGGWGYSLAVQSDGTVWAWGKNYWGELGIGTLDDQATPTKVVLP